MHRFYLPPERCREEPLRLDRRESHHALHVLRLRRGESAVVLDGAGVEHRCQVEGRVKDEVWLRVQETRRTPPPAWRVTLVQALPKGKLLESIIQKATELGVWEIVPLLSERSVVQLDAADAVEKAARWQSTAIEAIKQCGATWLPKVRPPLTAEKYLAERNRFELDLVGALQPGADHPRAHFDRFRREHQRAPGTIRVWIGPEGDFTPRELSLVLAGGAAPICLGRLVLRTETAAIYSLSIVNYEMQSANGPS